MQGSCGECESNDMTKEEIRRIRPARRDAYDAGKRPVSNPYQQMYPHWLRWEEGYFDRKDESRRTKSHDHPHRL